MNTFIKRDFIGRALLEITTHRNVTIFRVLTHNNKINFTRFEHHRVLVIHTVRVLAKWRDLFACLILRMDNLARGMAPSGACIPRGSADRQNVRAPFHAVTVSPVLSDSPSDQIGVESVISFVRNR